MQNRQARGKSALRVPLTVRFSAAVLVENEDGICLQVERHLGLRQGNTRNCTVINGCKETFYYTRH